MTRRRFMVAGAARVIPAIARPGHLAEDVGAGLVPLPGEALRRRMADLRDP